MKNTTQTGAICDSTAFPATCRVFNTKEYIPALGYSKDGLNKRFAFAPENPIQANILSTETCMSPKLLLQIATRLLCNADSLMI